MITTDVVQQLIVAGIRASYDVDRGGTTTEVDLLIGLFTRTLPALHAELARANARVSVSGLYVHQRPLVFWPPGLRSECAGRCEICDLLIVAHDRPSGRWQALAQQVSRHGGSPPDSVRRALSDLAGSDRAFDVRDSGGGPLYRRRDSSRL
jgi:hypothetical protein